MPWVLALSLLCVVLVYFAVRGVTLETDRLWRLLIVAAGIAIAVQAWAGLQVMASPWRLESWQLSWPAVVGVILICGRGFLWKNWI